MLDDLGNAAERDLLVQKQLHRDLIRRVEHGRRRATSPRGVTTHDVGREPLWLERFERQRPRGHRIEPAHAMVGHPVGIGQRVQYWQLHRWESYLRQHRAVYELGESMNDGLRMNDHLNLVVAHREQEMRFDHLERLVHERRRIDRDFPPHGPGGMFERFGDGGTRHALRTPRAERTTRGGEDQARQLRRPPARHALEHRAVLGIDRHDLAATLPRRPRDQLARHDERFLVGERHALPRSQCSQRRLEPRGADDAVDDDLDIGMRRGFDEAGGTLPPSLVPLPRAIHQPHIRRLPLLRLLGEEILVRVPGDGDDAKPLPLSRQHLEG